MISNQDSKTIQMMVVAILSANVFIFLPFTLYLGNLDQIRAPAFEILQLCLIPALLSFLFILFTERLIPTRFTQHFTIFVATLSILFWLQANVIPWDYGILNGRNIDWDQ